MPKLIRACRDCIHIDMRLMVGFPYGTCSQGCWDINGERKWFSAGTILRPKPGHPSRKAEDCPFYRYGPGMNGLRESVAPNGEEKERKDTDV